MSTLHFTWDDRKASLNQKKHSISFDEAQSAFYDDNARLSYDLDHSEDEDRFVLLGMSYALRVLVVCHCYREGNTLIRIISARKATKREHKQYKGFLL